MYLATGHFGQLQKFQVNVDDIPGFDTEGVRAFNLVNVWLVLLNLVYPQNLLEQLANDESSS